MSFEDIKQPERIGRYRVLGRLGQGGMAFLYLGRAEGPGGFERLVAIKMIHPHLCQEKSFVEMFLDEARIAAKIHHPNVVPVYEVDKHEDRYYIAMDYIHGETLAATLTQRWKTFKTFPIEVAALITSICAEALHAAHELKDLQGKSLHVIHRDVSPQNVMIGYDGIVRVADFGIAKAADRLSHTGTGVLKGKVAYMAPEQIKDRSLDRRVDTFALGVMLWETIAGKRLFKGSNDFATAERVMRLKVPEPSQMRPDCPSELDRIILKAVLRNPKERFQTARELAVELRRFLAERASAVSAMEIEQFMKETFPDRFQERLQMFQRATAKEVEQIELNASEDSSSLSNMTSDSDFEVESGGEINPTDDAFLEFEKPTTVMRESSTPKEATSPSGFFESSSQIEASLKEPSLVTPWRRTGLMAVVFATFVAIAAIMIFVWPVQPSKPTPASEMPKEVPVPEEVPKKVTITFDLAPADATITVDGKQHTGDLQVEQSDQTYKVVVAAVGHLKQTREVSATRSQQLSVALKKKKVQKPKRRVKRKKRKKRPPRDMFNSGDL